MSGEISWLNYIDVILPMFRGLCRRTRSPNRARIQPLTFLSWEG